MENVPTREAETQISDASEKQPHSAESHNATITVKQSARAITRSDSHYVRAMVKLAKVNNASGINIIMTSGSTVQLFFAQSRPLLDSGEAGGKHPRARRRLDPPTMIPPEPVPQCKRPTPRSHGFCTWRALGQSAPTPAAELPLPTQAPAAELPLPTPVAEPFLAQVSTLIVAEPPLLKTAEQLRQESMQHFHTGKVLQLAALGFDPCVTESILDDAGGDVDKAVDLLIAAKAREEQRAEAERQQETREAEAEATAAAKARAIAKADAVKIEKNAKAKAKKAEAASDKEAKAKAAEAKTAPAPAPAPPTPSPAPRQTPKHRPAPTAPPTLDNLPVQQHTNPHAQASAKPHVVRVPISGKQRTPMPNPSGPTAEARAAAAPPKLPKKPADGKDPESSAAT
jgi:hypothetical protein